MNAQLNPLSPSIDYFRNLSASTLGDSKEMIFWHLDHTQEFISRSSKQLRETLSSLGKVQKAEKWPETLGDALRSTIEISRDYAIKAAAYQQESYKLLQQQAIEAQKALSESLAEQFTVLQSASIQPKHAGKKIPVTQRAAA